MSNIIPNFLYPNSVDLYVSRNLKGLRNTTSSVVAKKLIKWLSLDHDNTKLIDIVPSSLPCWAEEKINAEDFYVFRPSDDNDRKIRDIVKFLHELEHSIKKHKNKSIAQRADKTLRKVKRMTVQDMLKAADDWNKYIVRQEIFVRKSSEMSQLLVDSGCVWIECTSVKQMRNWGKKLHNCLADDEYLDDFIHNGESGFRLFGLFDSNKHLLCVAASEDGELIDFEGQGEKREERQKNATKYREEIYQLLVDQNIFVNPNNDVLIYRSGVLGTTFLGEPLFTHDHQNETIVIFWVDSQNEQLILGVNYSGEITLYTLNMDELKGLTKTPSLKAWLCQYTSDQFSDYIIQKLFTSECYKSLSSVLSLLPDCDNVGNHISMYNDSNAYVADTKVGQFIRPLEGNVVWWKTKNNKVFRFEEDHWVSNLNMVLIDMVGQSYEKQGYFWNNLASHHIYFPNLIVSESGEPQYGYATLDGCSMTPKESWKILASEGTYSLKWRIVDYVYDAKDKRMIKAEQWICFKDEHSCCGALVILNGERKKEIRLQAPGCDPFAYQLLSKTLPNHSYVDFWYNSGHDWNDKLYADRFEICNEPSRFEGIDGYWYQKRNLITILDNTKRVVILATVRDKVLFDAYIVQSESPLIDLLPTIMMQIGLPIDVENPLVSQLRYELFEGNLIEPRQKPCSSQFQTIDQMHVFDEAAEIRLGDEIIEFYLDSETDELDISFYDEQYVDDSKELAHAIELIAFYWGVSISFNACKLLGLKREGDRYRYAPDKPEQWYGRVDYLGQYGWYFESKTDVHEPITIIEGNIQIQLGQQNLVSKYLQEINCFQDWLDNQKYPENHFD